MVGENSRDLVLGNKVIYFSASMCGLLSRGNYYILAVYPAIEQILVKYPLCAWTR
jgi:hypothetical protein